MGASILLNIFSVNNITSNGVHDHHPTQVIAPLTEQT